MIYNVQAHINPRWCLVVNQDTCAVFWNQTSQGSLPWIWWNILVANLATNFQDLVAKVKNLVALAPVLGAISRPDKLLIQQYYYKEKLDAGHSYGLEG